MSRDNGTDITVVRGDSKSWLCTITEDVAPFDPIDLSEAAIRVAVGDSSCANETSALVLLQTYDPEEVNITDAAAGQLTFALAAHQTAGLCPGQYVWGLELVRPGVLRQASPAAGTASVAAGSDLITFTDPEVPSDLHPGDLIDLTAAAVGANQVRAVVVDTPGSDPSLDSSTVRVGFTGWVAEASVAFSAYRGNVKSVDKLHGLLTVCPELG